MVPMGVQFYAQVEYQNQEDDSPNVWWPLSVWDLGKDFTFSAVLSEAKISAEGFPPDTTLISEPDYGDGCDVYNPQTTPGEPFSKLDFKECFETTEELQDHVRRLIARGFVVQVLTWQD